LRYLIIILGIILLLGGPGLANEIPKPPLNSSKSPQPPVNSPTPPKPPVVKPQPPDNGIKNPDHPPDKPDKDYPADGWLTLTLFLIPALVGLIVAVCNERIDEKLGYSVIAGPMSPIKSKPRFLCAAINALAWMVILVVLALRQQYSFDFFNLGLKFELFVPIFGFLGALLYVLDLSRRGREDIPLGTEFGMRIIMGPYVAIVVVVLVGQDFEHVDLKSPVGRGFLAFASGLVVVAALQRLIEASQEKLGEWRKRSRYEPSEIAREFHIVEEEDLKLRKADIRYLIQLKEYSVEDLKEKANNVGFDEHLAAGLKQENDKRLLYKAIGDMVWRTLKKQVKVETLEDFAHLTDVALKQVANADDRISLDDLKNLRDEVRDKL
jgi:hypothetical protein